LNEKNAAGAEKVSLVYARNAGQRVIMAGKSKNLKTGNRK
jgi:hypothetical protein